MKLDNSTDILLKAGLYTNVPANLTELENFNLFMNKKVFKQISSYSLMRFFYFSSFFLFAQKFNSIMTNEVLKHRSEWLLLQADPLAIARLELKYTQKYFEDLDLRLFENYVSNLESSSLSNFVAREYYKIRKNSIIYFFKKHTNFIIFWSVLLLSLCIGLNITAKENSLTVWELIKGWYNFLMLRLK